MHLVDLHVHSNYSDGTLSPGQLVSLAVEKGLRAIALTDHDTTEGVKDALDAAAGTSLQVIPGAELSCLRHGKEIHMLGLFVDYTKQDFLDALRNQRLSRDRRNLEMLRRLSEDGMELTMEDLRGGEPEAVITRAHFARALVKNGYVSTMDQAFRKYLDHGKKHCPPKEAFTPEEAIGLILAAGGFPVIAHPMLYKMSFKETETMITEFKDAGLLGVEVYYSSHNQYDSGRLMELCKKLELFPTGGSDFHGLNKPDIQLGSGRGRLRVPWLLLKDIEAYRSKSVRTGGAAES